MQVTIKHTNKKGIRLLLSEKDTLDAVRKILMQHGIMAASDKFILQGYEFLMPDEANEILANVLENGTLTIGTGERVKLSTDTEKADNYTIFTDEEKRALFVEGEIFKGVVFHADNIGFSTEDTYKFDDDYMPAAAEPAKNTIFSSEYSFSESMRELNLLSSDKASLSLESVYADASAEYSHAKEIHSKERAVSEYLLAKYLICKLKMELNPKFLKPTDNFLDDIRNVFIKTNMSDNDKRYFLVQALNKYGAYIPLKFTLGGKIYTKEQTEISEFSYGEKEMNEFSASAKVKLTSVSAGGEYSSSEKSDTADTQNSKYSTLTIEQIGGATGLCKTPDEFNKSLNTAVNWKIIDVETFYPTLSLLLGIDDMLVGKCVKLLNNVNDNRELINKIQPYINLQKYAAVLMYHMEQV